MQIPSDKSGKCRGLNLENLAGRTILTDFYAIDGVITNSARWQSEFGRYSEMPRIRQDGQTWAANLWGVTPNIFSQFLVLCWARCIARGTSNLIKV